MHDFEYQITNAIFVIRYSNGRIYLWKPIEHVIFQGDGDPDPCLHSDPHMLLF